jgi:hypothetical protein
MRRYKKVFQIGNYKQTKYKEKKITMCMNFLVLLFSVFFFFLSYSPQHFLSMFCFRHHEALLPARGIVSRYAPVVMIGAPVTTVMPPLLASPRLQATSGSDGAAGGDVAAPAVAFLLSR